MFTKQFPEAVEAAQTGVALDPNAAYGYFAMGQAEVSLGRCEQSIAHIRQAFALSPRDPIGGAWYTILGASEICLGRLDAAIGEFKRAVNVGYRNFFPYAFLAGVEAARGTTPRRNPGWQRRVVSNPQFTIRWFVKTGPPAPPMVIEGLRKAGLPEE